MNRQHHSLFWACHEDIAVLLKKIVSGWFRLRTQNLLKIVVHVIFAIVYSAVHFYSSVYTSTCTKVSWWWSSIVLLFQTRCYKLIKKILIRPNNLYESLSFKMGDSRIANSEALSSELIFYVNGKKVTKEIPAIGTSKFLFNFYFLFLTSFFLFILLILL